MKRKMGMAIGIVMTASILILFFQNFDFAETGNSFSEDSQSITIEPKVEFEEDVTETLTTSSHLVNCPPYGNVQLCPPGGQNCRWTTISSVTTRIVNHFLNSSACNADAANFVVQEVPMPPKVMGGVPKARKSVTQAKCLPEFHVGLKRFIYRYYEMRLENAYLCSGVPPVGGGITHDN